MQEIETREKDKSVLKDNTISFKVKNRLRNLLLKNRFLARFNHNIQSLKVKSRVVSSASDQFDDTLLVERLKAFYLVCNANFDSNGNSVWSGIFSHLHGDIHSAFIKEDDKKIFDILRNPRSYNLFYGFENLSRDLLKNKRLEDIFEPQMAMDSLISLCEAVGLINLSNPESLKIHEVIDAEEAIQLLENEFGFELTFPNPFIGEFGIDTKKGILSYRAVQAVYQAWQISKIVKCLPEPRILEIGGGLGRTAYFCQLFGIKDYTIVDIPISSLAQGNFLGRVLPAQDLVMIGESMDAEECAKIKLIHPKAFFASDERYDLIVNFDSLTELDIEIAKEYLKKISKTSNQFLSVNHEFNSFSINSISRDIPEINRVFRNPCWVRRGYVEELFENSHLEA